MKPQITQMNADFSNRDEQTNANYLKAPGLQKASNTNDWFLQVFVLPTRSGRRESATNGCTNPLRTWTDHFSGVGKMVQENTYG